MVGQLSLIQGNLELGLTGELIWVNLAITPHRVGQICSFWCLQRALDTRVSKIKSGIAHCGI